MLFVLSLHCGFPSMLLMWYPPKTQVPAQHMWKRSWRVCDAADFLHELSCYRQHITDYRVHVKGRSVWDCLQPGHEAAVSFNSNAITKSKSTVAEFIYTHWMDTDLRSLPLTTLLLNQECSVFSIQPWIWVINLQVELRGRKKTLCWILGINKIDSLFPVFVFQSDFSNHRPL